MARVEKSIQVNVPLQTAYNQWTQFEEFPRFMEGIREVRQLDDARLNWVAEIGGETKEWEARITQQVPDQVVAWESEGGVPNAGVVTFHRMGGDQTEVNVSMEYEPEDFKEAVGDKLGFVARRVEGDLKRFKEFIEERGVETGAWRGKIDQGDVSGRQTYETTDRRFETEREPAESVNRDSPGPGMTVESTRGGAYDSTGPAFTDRPEGDTRELPRRDQYGTEGGGGTNYGGTRH
jgi:uncharacterized membrane protein